MAQSPSDPPWVAGVALSMPSLPGSVGLEGNHETTNCLAVAAMCPTYSAPRTFIPANATPKSSMPMMKYTPSAYHPYDVMRYLSFWENEAFGGRVEDVGEGEREFVRRAGMWWKRRFELVRPPCRVSEPTIGSAAA